MRKFLQYAIIVLLGLNSTHAFNPLKSMSNMATGCKPSVVRDVAKLLSKAKNINALDGDVNFHKKVGTMNRCIGTDAAALKKNHADIAKTTASICSSDKKFASKFSSQCKLAITANKAIQAELKAKNDKAKRAKAKKASKPSMFSRMMGRGNKKAAPIKDDMDDSSFDDASIDDAATDSSLDDDFDDASSQVCSPQMPGQAQAPYGPPAYGVPPAGQAYGAQMYGQQPQNGMTPPPAYGYPQPQGAYQDPAMGGQIPYPQSIYPQAPGLAPAFAGQIVNTPQGPVCSCQR